MKITLWRDDATLAHGVTAAGERHDVRTRLLLGVEHGGVTGYGEVGVQPAALNGDPSLDGVVAELRSRTMLVRVADGDSPVSLRASEPATGWATPGARRFASALVEMALWDLDLRSRGVAVRDQWPACQATGTMGTVSALDDSPWDVAVGVARLRVKTRPGPLGRDALERLSSAGLPVLLDFNASAATLDDVIAQVALVARVADLVGVEQPFAPGDVTEHAALARRVDVPVGLDEGVRGVADLDAAVAARAAGIICVKPARVGGLVAARVLMARAVDHGVAAYVGGFFESAFARSVHRVLADSLASAPSDVGLVARRDFDELEAVETPDGLGWAPSGALLAHARTLVSLG